MLLMSVVVVGGLSVAIVPRAIEGASWGAGAETVEVAPRDESARAVYERVRMLFQSSVGIVGCWDRGEGGVEVALWQRDVRDPGIVNSDEVVLLSFSRVLGGLVAYVEGTGAPVVEGVTIEGGAGPARGVALERGDVLGRGFGAWWRARPGIERHVIAGGLADMRVAPRGEAGGLETLSVELVWGRSSADDGVEKGAFEVALRRLDAGP